MLFKAIIEELLHKRTSEFQNITIFISLLGLFFYEFKYNLSLST